MAEQQAANTMNAVGSDDAAGRANRTGDTETVPGDEPRSSGGAKPARRARLVLEEVAAPAADAALVCDPNDPESCR